MNKNVISFSVKTSKESRLIAHVQDSAKRSQEWPRWKQTLLGTNCSDDIDSCSKQTPESRKDL